MTSLPVSLIGFVIGLGALALIFAALNWDMRSPKYARMIYGSVMVLSAWGSFDAITTGEVRQAVLWLVNVALFLFVLIRFWNGRPKAKSPQARQ